MPAGFVGILGATGVGAAAVPPVYCPQGETMDSLALFTHGEFLEFGNDCPELLLYTHGEFPRPLVLAPTKPTKPGKDAGSGGAATGKWRREQEYWQKEFDREQRRLLENVRRRNEEVIALSLLALESDDDWF